MRAPGDWQVLDLGQDAAAAERDVRSLAGDGAARVSRPPGMAELASSPRGGTP